MTVAEYIVKSLKNIGTTDFFGIPGGVILEFLHAADKETDINIHLSTHEQSAGYSALGYAQYSGKLGVAYATRGPGFTNLLTPMADAFFDSIPVLFITAHSKEFKIKDSRFSEEQEFDTVSIVKNMTKLALRVESVEQVKKSLLSLLKNALTGRPGSVFFDIKESVLRSEINDILIEKSDIFEKENESDFTKILTTLKEELKKAKRPVLVLGNGIHQSKTELTLKELSDKLNIPVVSSCISQDLLKNKSNYFGYVGSHGARCANFILYHSDLIISLGNRMAFNHKSESFGSISQKKIIRIDVDENELKSPEENEIVFNADLEFLLPFINKKIDLKNSESNWLENCRTVKEIFNNCDKTQITNDIEKILNSIDSNFSIVSDVGNNEFFLSQAYLNSLKSNRFLMAKSFAALGCSIPKSIGVYYATKKTVINFIGDQAFLFNVQDLFFIQDKKLPIKIILLNNSSSGMIKSKQKSQKRDKYVHATKEYGYSIPDFKKLVEGFDIEYYDFSKLLLDDFKSIFINEKPCVIELKIDGEAEVPVLPKGNLPWNFIPEVDNDTEYKINLIIKEIQ